MSPDVGRYRPRIRRPNVVLPDPVSPTRARVSPRLMASEIPSTALSVGRRPTPPWPVAKCLVTPTVSMMGTPAGAPGAGGPPAGLAAGTAGSLGHVVLQREPARVRAAVDLEHRTGDMAGLRRGEEQHRVRDVARVTGPAERDRADQRGPQVLGRPVRAGVTPAAYVDVAGRDHVHPDAERAKFHRENLAHDLYRGLRGTVGGTPRARAARGAGGDADHGGADGAAGGAVPGERLGQHERAGDVDREHPVPGRRRHVEQRPVRVGSRVVDEDVRRAEPAHGGPEDLLGEPRPGDVPGDAGDPGVAREDIGRHQVRDHHGAAFAEETRGDGPPDAMGAAADDGHPAGETALCQSLPPPDDRGPGAATPAARSAGTTSMRCYEV